MNTRVSPQQSADSLSSTRRLRSQTNITAQVSKITDTRHLQKPTSPARSVNRIKTTVGTPQSSDTAETGKLKGPRVQASKVTRNKPVNKQPAISKQDQSPVLSSREALSAAISPGIASSSPTLRKFQIRPWASIRKPSLPRGNFGAKVFLEALD